MRGSRIRRLQTLGMGGSGALEYWQKVKNLFGAHLIDYQPIWETAGTLSYDISGNVRNGAYQTGITLANATSPNGKPAALFGPASGCILINNVNQITAAFNKAEGAIGFFFKMAPGIWDAAAARNIMTIFTDTNNRVIIGRGGNASDNRKLNFTFLAGGVNRTYTVPMHPSGWGHAMFSWSVANSRVRAWTNGILQGTPGAPGTWAGALTTNQCTIGGWTNATQLHSGWISDVIILDYEPTPEQVFIAATSQIRPVRMTVLGDSITMYNTNLTNWAVTVASEYNQSRVGLMNHAENGANIIGSLAGQVTAAANDDADLILIHMGTNDVDGGNMATLQGVVETAIDNLRASNPRATIKYINVLPRWTDNTGAVEVDKSHIRAAIAAGCLAKGVPCHDPYTVPVITAAKTSDGLHPLTAGHADIAAWELALP